MYIEMHILHYVPVGGALPASHVFAVQRGSGEVVVVDIGEREISSSG